ncbi:CGNR zinc finger domain-containing protein [Streptomyces sp. NPDC018833]|uniref:CGNR zinc finger domain-containing protein n=1 Tax=Streptomyces sp. NPDC018833 TaxID=3365053 RepID=UPI00378AABB5
MATGYSGYVGDAATETPGLLLRTAEGRPYRFDAGALCLELLTTGGPGEFARYEVLDEPGGLLHWVAASRLTGGLRLDVDDAAIAEIRRLRDALWRMACARAHSREPDPADVATVNAAAAEPSLAFGIAADGSRQWAPGPAPVSQLLSTVARDAVELFTGPYAHRVRECATPDCYLLFVDTSRPGRRRWCAMEHCGNRNKVRAHRSRHAKGDGS